jgi:L-arabinose isomerase
MNPSPPVRAAVVSPYWTFWEASAGGSTLRDDRRRLLAEAIAALRRGIGPGGLDVACEGLLDSPDAGAALAGGVEGELDVIVVVVAMAAPPTHGLAFLDRFPTVPVVVWAVQRSRNIRVGFDASDITSAGTAVGTPQLTNMLARSGRAHDIVVGALDGGACHERPARAVRLAAVAGSLRRARIARVGQPPPGYVCVDTDAEALERATGIGIVDVDPAELRRRWCAVDEASTDRLRQEVEATAEIAVAWDTAGRRSLAGAAALEALDDELQVAAGAMNCHVPEFRFGAEVGVTPCYGLGRETSRGIPWTCAGDVLTAVAMLVGKRLSGAALYHELEVMDFDTDEVAIANSGEHDLAWCPVGRRPRLQPNPWYTDDPLTGASMWFELPPGPASLIGFTPHAAEPSGYRFIVAEGHITERSLPHSPTVGGVFRFAGEAGVAESWRAWAAAGVNHHSSAGPGHLAADVATVSHHLGVGCIRVS